MGVSDRGVPGETVITFTIRLLQANLNHALSRQDMFFHSLGERNAGLGVLDSYRVSIECW